MKTKHHTKYIVLSFVVLSGVVIWLLVAYSNQQIIQSHPNNRRGMQAENSEKVWSKNEGDLVANGQFPLNDSMEIPFLGVVRCHARQEDVPFTASGKQMKWPFKVYYLENGMFVRAEFIRSGAKIYEEEPKIVAALYRSWGQRLVGFPSKPAPASLNRVLKSLYENEPFDSATKISITWVLREGTDGKIHPWFIANVFGVSAGLAHARVPADDERFLAYRILLTPDGEAVSVDNCL